MIITSSALAFYAHPDFAVTAARHAGCKDLTLLKCTSTYPATPANSNILTIPHLKQLFGCEVGLSDHTMGIGVAVAAVAHGATVIEKHFTLSRAEGGVDSAFSMEPHELKMLVEETKRAWESLGQVSYGPTEAERKSLIFRRSIYVAKDIKAGEIFTKENIRVVRPGLGLAPKYYETILGRSTSAHLKKITPVNWELI